MDLDLLNLEDKRITKLLGDALKEVFDTNTEKGKFIDVSRIPLICKSIIDIHENIKDIKESLDKKFVTQESFAPIKAIVYGGVAITLTTVLGWFLLLLKK